MKFYYFSPISVPCPTTTNSNGDSWVEVAGRCYLYEAGKKTRDKAEDVSIP